VIHPAATFFEGGPMSTLSPTRHSVRHAVRVSALLGLSLVLTVSVVAAIASVVDGWA
jgi:hypothetical protein